MTNKTQAHKVANIFNCCGHRHNSTKTNAPTGNNCQRGATAKANKNATANGRIPSAMSAYTNIIIKIQTKNDSNVFFIKLF